MSSTHFCHKRLSLCIFYGCSHEQSLDIERRLDKAGPSICHPMLAPGILVEIDRGRLVGRIEFVTDDFVDATETLSCLSSTSEPALIQEAGGRDNITGLLFGLYNQDRELASGIPIVMNQISGMIQHLVELESMPAPPQRKKKFRKKLRAGDRREVNTAYEENMDLKFRERLQEIRTEYNQKLDQCHMVLESLSFTTQRASDFSNVLISFAMKKESTQMRSIALVTMIFLPVTSVASVFSMGVFNWSAPEGKSVLTVYFWVYVAIAGALTIGTVVIWSTLTRANRGTHGLLSDPERLASV
ncbi:hypothetical protein GGR54DRAFT_347119 [Hypoxylon sp. NC1633]|nr:hypothetical protein GGR54DRAFT_347119 [Hypoxylon sp. NC1633]